MNEHEEPSPTAPSSGPTDWSASKPDSLRERAETVRARPDVPERRPDDSATRPSDRMPRRHPRLLIGLAVALSLAVPLIGVFAFLWQSAEDDRGELDEARRTAGTFAERFLTVDSENIDRTREGVLELSTGAFRRNYEEALETGLFEAILSLGRTRTDATIEEVFVGDLDQRAAHVIVQAEVVSRTVDEEGNEQPPRVLELYLELDLVKQSEGWLVDNVRNLPFGTGGGGSEAGG